MSSNLLKSGWVNVSGSEKRVIDSNLLVTKKLDALKAALVYSSGDNFVEGFTEGLEAIQVAELLGEDLNKSVYQGPTPDELLAKAKEEIAEYKKNAEQEIEQLKKTAREEGRKLGEKEGYDAGYQKGLNQTQALERELQERAELLNQDYEKKLDVLEPEMIDTLTDIYEHVFNVDFSQHRGILLHLLTNALRKIEGTRDFIVHVSKEDYPYVSMHKKQIIELSGTSNSTIEIIEDITLGKNECIIETAGGIFDCGLGTQLEELSKKLKLLSYGSGNK